MLDIFKSDAFGVVPLTDAINGIKFAPSLIGSWNLFQESGVATTSVALEQRDGTIALISPSQRGAPGSVLDQNKRSLRNLSIPHYEINGSVMADEVQGVRAWGSETETETVMGKVTEKLGTYSQSIEVTLEYARVGAVKGIITYAGGETTNLFTEFGVSAPAAIDLDLDNASPAPGALRKKLAGIVRKTADALGGVPFGGIRAIVGSDLMDALVAHPEVRDSYLNWQAAADLREGYAYGAPFNFGGIEWVEYRGNVGGTQFVAADRAHFFPVGVPGLFRTYFGPADYVETVNTIGQRAYAKQYEMANGKGINLDVQSNALSICTRPLTLLTGTLS